MKHVIAFIVLIPFICLFPVVAILYVTFGFMAKFVERSEPAMRVIDEVFRWLDKFIDRSRR